jgi:hypothetical protein
MVVRNDDGISRFIHDITNAQFHAAGAARS